MKNRSSYSEDEDIVRKDGEEKSFPKGLCFSGFATDGNPVRIRDIRDIVKRRIEANDKLIVSIESHPDASYQSMIDILDEVKLARATRFALKMRRP